MNFHVLHDLARTNWCYEWRLSINKRALFQVFWHLRLETVCVNLKAVHDGGESSRLGQNVEGEKCKMASAESAEAGNLAIDGEEKKGNEA